MNISFPSNMISSRISFGQSTAVATAGRYISPFFKNSESDTFVISSSASAGTNLKKGQILDKRGNIFTRDGTKMFREDINWVNFAQYIKEKYSNNPKVNTYIYACSNGSEAYTMSILLQNFFGGNAKKFFPIVAKDIDDKTIQRNKFYQEKKPLFNDTGYNGCKNQLHMTDRQTKDYMEESNFKGMFMLSEKTISPVRFSSANILEDIPNIDSHNPSIVMCRNMWPYVNPNEYNDFAKQLYEKLAPNSCVIVGMYDLLGDFAAQNSSKFPQALIDAGFTPSDAPIGNVHKNPKQCILFEKRAFTNRN